MENAAKNKERETRLEWIKKEIKTTDVKKESERE